MALALADSKEIPAGSLLGTLAQRVHPTRVANGMAERGWLPDAVIRAGIRSTLQTRLDEERAKVESGVAEAFLASLPEAPIALNTDAANEQHYEVPAAFYTQVLGPRRKYSCAWYETPDTTLAQAEEAMLALTTERAEIADGMHVLELGCGWGSLTLYLAERFPNAKITGVSNSRSQREYILATARERGLANVRIITADINNFVAPGFYDRVVSVEMFEHLRNHARMLQRIADWLRPSGKVFVHHFCHREYCYPYEVSGPSDWMAQYFFTGGMMPSFDLLSRYPRDLKVEASWKVNGKHYERTCNDWLKLQDRNRAEVTKVLGGGYGESTGIWFQRWRIFFMACAELFAYNGGEEWFIGHYRLSRA